MQLKTILNRVQKFKSFVYTAVRWIEHLGEPALEVEIEPMKKVARMLRRVCSESHRAGI